MSFVLGTIAVRANSSVAFLFSFLFFFSFLMNIRAALNPIRAWALTEQFRCLVVAVWLWSFRRGYVSYDSGIKILPGFLTRTPVAEQLGIAISMDIFYFV